jgi:hypothetical protein
MGNFNSRFTQINPKLYLWWPGSNTDESKFRSNFELPSQIIEPPHEQLQGHIYIETNPSKDEKIPTFQPKHHHIQDLFLTPENH